MRVFPELSPYITANTLNGATCHSTLPFLPSHSSSLFPFPLPLLQEVNKELEVLSEFNFTVNHRSGQKHTNADALSCGHCPQCGLTDSEAGTEELDGRPIPVIAGDPVTELPNQATVAASSNWIPTLELQQCQQADPDLHQIISWVETQSMPTQYHASHRLQTLWSQRQQLIVQDHVLYRRWKDIPHGSAHKHLQIILPKALIPTVLKELHNTTTGGHLGVEKNLPKARTRFYWASQRHDVEDWCRSCPMHVCF